MLQNKNLTLSSFVTLTSFDNLKVSSNSEFEIAEMVISRLFDWKTLTSVEGHQDLFYTLLISKYSTEKVESESQTKF